MDEQEQDKEYLKDEWAAFCELFIKNRKWRRKEFAKACGVTSGAVTGWINKEDAPKSNHISHMMERNDLTPEESERLQLLSFLALRRDGWTQKSLDIITRQNEIDGMDELETVNYQLQKAVRWFGILDSIDRGLFDLFAGPLRPQEAERFCYGMFHRVFDYFGTTDPSSNEPLVTRACVYTPDEDDPNYLTIRWPVGFNGESRLRNRWYIGNDDAMPQIERGTPGWVWKHERGLSIPDVEADDRFINRRADQGYTVHNSLLNGRPPYKSLVQALIASKDRQQKIGVVSFDSLLYGFTEHDLSLIELLAVRIGWLLQRI